MAEKKGASYASFGSQWVESKYVEIRKYLDDNPLDQLVDRTDLRATPNGGSTTVVVSSKEVQVKSIRDSTKDLSELIEVMGKMREKDAIDLNIDEDKGAAYYVEDELNHLEYMISQIKQYIDDNPIDKLVDRKLTRMSSKGNQYEVSAATKEQQMTCIRQTIKDVIVLENFFNSIQKTDKVKTKLRGSSKMNLLMERHLNKNK